MATPILTPVGRIVQGSISKPQTTDFYGKPLVWNKGPNAGQPRVQYYVGLAVDKNDPGIAALFALLQTEAAAGFPGGESTRDGFAWKFLDGDGTDAKGQSYANREGHAGCFIFRFNTSFAPGCFKANEQGGGMLEIAAEEIKSGHYARISGSVDTNGDTNKPGLFLNLSMIQWVAFGDEIKSGPNPNDVFGGLAVAPAGSSATPTAAPQAQMQPAPMQPAQMQPAPMQPAPTQPAPMQPAIPQQPNGNFGQVPGQ